MDAEQKIRFAGNVACIVVALTLVFIVWAFVQHPWDDTMLMLEFSLQREGLQKMKAEGMVVCPANSYCVANARFPFVNCSGFVYGGKG